LDSLTLESEDVWHHSPSDKVSLSRAQSSDTMLWDLKSFIHQWNLHIYQESNTTQDLKKKVVFMIYHW